MEQSNQNTIRQIQSTFTNNFKPSSNFTAVLFGNEQGIFDFFGDKRKPSVPKKLLEAMEERYRYFYFDVFIDQNVASLIQANLGLPPASVLLAYRGNKDKVLRAKASDNHEEFCKFHLNTGMNDLYSLASKASHKYFKNISEGEGGPALFLASLSRESERYKFASYIESILIEFLCSEEKEYYQLDPYQENGRKMFEQMDEFEGANLDFLNDNDPFCIRGCRFAKN